MIKTTLKIQLDVQVFIWRILRFKLNNHACWSLTLGTPLDNQAVLCMEDMDRFDRYLFWVCCLDGSERSNKNLSKGYGAKSETAGNHLFLGRHLSFQDLSQLMVDISQFCFFSCWFHCWTPIQRNSQWDLVLLEAETKHSYTFIFFMCWFQPSFTEKAFVEHEHCIDLTPMLLKHVKTRVDWTGLMLRTVTWFNLPAVAYAVHGAIARRSSKRSRNGQDDSGGSRWF